jgi:PEP-CTERM motif
MKSLVNLCAVAICLLPVGARASQIVNVEALSPTGTSITLGAGSYQVNIIGTSQGGAYDGWDSQTSANGTPGPNAWAESYTITIGGVSTSYVAPGNPDALSALSALANYQASVLTPIGTPPAATSLAVNTALFTLGSSQTVNFTVSDYYFLDNWGGVSFAVTAVGPNATPEPSTFGMIGLTLAGGIGLLRRRIIG